MLNEFELKHVRSKAWRSQAQGIVERYQRNLRESIGRWRSSTGRSDWSRVLDDLVFSYNSSVHSTIGVEPAVAVHQSLSGDTEMIDYIRAKSFKAAKKSMSSEGPMLQVGDTVRISIYAISNKAVCCVSGGTEYFNLFSCHKKKHTNWIIRIGVVMCVLQNVNMYNSNNSISLGCIMIRGKMIYRTVSCAACVTENNDNMTLKFVSFN